MITAAALLQKRGQTFSFATVFSDANLTIRHHFLRFKFTKEILKIIMLTFNC